MNKRKATVYIVAEHAGVSIATVSRAQAGSPDSPLLDDGAPADAIVGRSGSDIVV
jgi:hypothetical protein